MSNEKTKIRAAAMAAAVIAGTGMAGATNNNDKEAANTLIKETTYDNALKTAQQVEDDFLQAANVCLTTGELSEFEKDYAQIKLVGHRADSFTESQIDK